MVVSLWLVVRVRIYVGGRLGVTLGVGLGLRLGSKSGLGSGTQDCRCRAQGLVDIGSAYECAVPDAPCAVHHYPLATELGLPD